MSVYLEDYLVPPWESINILQSGDLVKVIRSRPGADETAETGETPRKNYISPPDKVSKSLAKASKQLKVKKSLKVPKNTGIDIQCPSCGDRRSKLTFKNHLLTHYAKVFTPLLPSTSPHTCPECSHRFRDKISLMRHYAFKHEKFFEVTDFTKERLKEIMIRGLVSKK